MSEQAKVVESAAELLEHVSFEHVHFEELHARKRTAEVPIESLKDPTIHVLTQSKDLQLLVRCVVKVETPDATYKVDAVAHFKLTDELEISDEVEHEFVERVGLMSIYPFVREAVASLSSKLGGAPTVLGLFRPGRVRMEPMELESENSDDGS